MLFYDLHVFSDVFLYFSSTLYLPITTRAHNEVVRPKIVLP